MKIAFPTQLDQGLESKVFGHFGSAPFFIIVDTDDGSTQSISNLDLDHEHGQCQPLKALGGSQADTVVVVGIGGGALRKLNASGLKVYHAVEGTVSENLELVKTGRLSEFSLQQTCAGHGIHGECIH